jgi:hypothetical protein
MTTTQRQFGDSVWDQPWPWLAVAAALPLVTFGLFGLAIFCGVL